MNSPIQQIIDEWRSRKQLAEDIGTTPGRVRHWYQRRSIPGEYWRDIVRAAKRRKIKLSLSQLADAQAREAGRLEETK